MLKEIIPACIALVFGIAITLPTVAQEPNPRAAAQGINDLNAYAELTHYQDNCDKELSSAAWDLRKMLLKRPGYDVTDVAAYDIISQQRAEFAAKSKREVRAWCKARDKLYGCRGGGCE